MPHVRFNVSVENSTSVNVLNGLEQLIYVELDSRLREIGCSSLDGFIKVHLHEFKDKC